MPEWSSASGSSATPEADRAEPDTVHAPRSPTPRPGAPAAPPGGGGGRDARRRRDPRTPDKPRTTL
eukprot:1731852-Prymnesium_polylepis.1